ncbi:MAG TPA: glycosyltransferase [Solirubrobacteraceae bacterium]|nr:glycosyltransferase [Solirubrobacteraceae bacterium]
MRLLIVVPWGSRLGGAEAMLQMALDGAQEAGHELELVFLERGPWPSELSDRGFRVEVLQAGRLRDARRGLATIVRLADIMRARKPDLILSWMGKAHLYSAPAALLARMGERTVWWQHGIPEGHWLDRAATLLPAIAVGASSNASALAQARMFPSRPTFVVAPGARTPTADPEPLALELPAAVPVIGIVGRLQPWKGQDRLLEAQALLRERGLLTHALLVGGDAHGLSPDYARSLPELVDRLGLDDAVTMTGQVPDAGPYIQRMDILVNASEAEPFGIVLLEAMARGVAVVAVDAGGPTEIVEDGRTGVLARSGDPRALADALETLLDSPGLRQAIARAGRERFMEDFTDVAMRARFFECIEAVLDAPCAVTIVAHDVGSIGGMERQLAELIAGLTRLGHEVTVIARTCELPADVKVKFRRVPGPRRPFLLFYPWFMLVGSLAVWRWRRGVVQATGAIVLNRVDVVAIHCCHQVYRAAPTRPGRLFRWNVAFGGLLKRAAERLCVRVNGASALVCVSEGVAEEMRTHYPHAAERTLAIHNGVDTEAFAPGAHTELARTMRAGQGIGEERLVAAFVAREWGHKGLQEAIEALALAPAWDLVVAGTGDRARYRELAESLGVGERVHWLGVVREIQVVYALADAFVLPSSYETFSLVTFEAAASALPILATPVSGVRDLIRDGENGFLIAAEPRDIADRLDELAGDAALRERLGAAARASALAFTWEEMVGRHRECYARLAPRAAR